jgi:predicted CXXCH cytochrome family protein
LAASTFGSSPRVTEPDRKCGRRATGLRLLALVVLLDLLPLRAEGVQDVASTVHNLSTSGPGAFKSLTVSEICVFCHTPHNANPRGPLWNRKKSGATYVEYGSSTLRASPGQPTGRSRLCLSCHDGTVALGTLVNLPGRRKTDLAETFLTGRATLGTDLTDDHPVSFTYDEPLAAAVGTLAAPNRIGLPLDKKELQCTTCHDPHEKDVVPFLHKKTLNGELCTSCHTMKSATESWAASSHATSQAQPSNTANPWAERKPEWRGRTVAENACFNCHTPHNAVTPPRLIKDREEETCFRCHDGTVAQTDIKNEIQKPYRHPVDLSAGDHDPLETFGTDPPPDHVECADCHNPHLSQRRQKSRSAAPAVEPGVRGIDSTGALLPESSRRHEICYKCHGGNNVMPGPVVTRQIFEMNNRLKFDIGNPSFHPVQGIGRNFNVPSLISELTERSLIDCTDCHNSDGNPDAGGRGASGPHGSIYEGLLERNYATADNTTESSVAYALCYKCHERTSILADESFSEHRRHVVDENTPCSACHDPHGVTSIRGNPTNNSHLINFDTTIVKPNGARELRFVDNGTFAGTCYLNCHGEEHAPGPLDDPYAYP